MQVASQAEGVHGPLRFVSQQFIGYALDGPSDFRIYLIARDYVKKGHDALDHERACVAPFASFVV